MPHCAAISLLEWASPRQREVVQDSMRRKTNFFARSRAREYATSLASVNGNRQTCIRNPRVDNFLMDTLAHGLWGGALFLRRPRREFFAAMFLGMTPDLLSFGIFHATHPGWISRRIMGEISGPPDLATLPAYVFHTYNITHSLIVWAAVFVLLWLIRKKPAWIVAAGILHILCDIPTHTQSYFPTPFIWPFPTPFVNGIPWSTPGFMIVNYMAIAVVYGSMFLFRRGAIDGTVSQVKPRRRSDRSRTP
jgi:hypothetical protein